MKLPMTCFACLQETEVPHLMMLSPMDTGVYTYSCPRGHSGRTILQQELFQLLFQVGIHALVDGYPREAVADFTAALERFYEFYFRVFCRIKGIGRDTEQATWSQVGSQSERQLGLFLGSYLAVNRTSGPTLSRKNIEFRNGVIHKGKIPSQEDALGFGKSVADLIQPLLLDLQHKHSDALQSLGLDRLMSAADGQTASTMFYPTFLSFSAQQRTLEEAVHEAGLPPWSYR